MKKSFLLFPLMAITLAGCNSNSTDVPQTAEVTEANSAWQTEVQPTAMPSTMTQPNYSTNNSYTIPQPSYSNGSYGGQSEMIGNCNVVRDGMNTPIYSQIQKGCYTGSTYTVGKSDTMFLIAYLTGRSVNELATLNNLNQPYQLKVGQVLRVK